MFRPCVVRSSPVQFCEQLEPRRLFSSVAPGVVGDLLTPSAIATEVTNRAPFSIIKANPTSGPAPLTVNFAGNDSYDTDNLSEVLNFAWDFGDGTGGGGAGLAGYYIAHTYNNAGQYTAKLTVTDHLGASGVSQTTINVTGATSTSETLRAAADTYARNGDFSSTNFGSSSELQVKSSSPGFTREAFLRFGMTSIANIASARLRIFGRLNSTDGNNVPLGLFAVSDLTWSESALNFNNRPASTGPLTQTSIVDTTARWYELDVTNYLKQQKTAGAAGVSFALKALASSTPYMTFNSDEASSNQPQLIVTAATTTSTNLIATDDTYARDGDFADTNFGSSGELISKLSTPGFSREIFLMFDLSSIPSAGAFNTGRLRLFGSLNDSATPPGLDVAIFATSTSWSESTLTWNARPSTTSVRLFSVPISSTTPQWYEWELTSWLKQEKAAGRNIVSFVIRNLGPSTQFARFASTESGANQPQLVFT